MLCQVDRRAAREQTQGILVQGGAQAFDGAQGGMDRATDDGVVGIGRQRFLMAVGMR